MGPLRADYTPKTAWTRLLQFMQFFNNGGKSPQHTQSYTASGEKLGMLDHPLFQRSDGTYLLALWLANYLYDPNNHAAQSPANQTVTLTLSRSVLSAMLSRFTIHA